MIDIQTNIAYIALGSNLGNRLDNLMQALNLLDEADHISVARVSQFFDTSPVGGPPGQSDYLNGVACLHCRLAPLKLLVVLLEIEDRLGRVRTKKWSPRTIDLDLLLFDSQVIDLPHLKIPHPLMHQRSFVMIPLAEIAPHILHPVLKKTAQQILDDLQSQSDRTPK